ncbi:MAG TPA: MaoC/PaaZ C-terminal domain-containing protein [Gemmatimonadaceae bacterium]|nr:MaoC/PaaZ C-terminal domain-containing protein [Gemmatimonadaceae bacterium]
MKPLWFEDFAVGARYQTGSRTLGSGDIDAFATVSGDLNPLHLDEAYASGTPFGGRIAHGVLGLAVATGLLNQLGLTRGTLVALAGIRWDFRAAIRPGDVLHAELFVAEARPTRREDAGLVRLAARLLNQHDVEVQEGQLTMLVRRRETAQAASTTTPTPSRSDD